MFQRLAISVVLGAFVGFALFLLMHSMIDSDQVSRGDSGRLNLVDFIQLDEPPEQLRTKQREKPKPPPPPEKPPPPELKVSQDIKPQQQRVRLDMPKIDALGTGTGPFLGQAGAAAMGGDLIPLVRIEPQYPRDALRDGLEGYVTVEFTVLEDGSVSDVAVVEAQPPRVFDREAIRAILKWKFKPRIVDGRPVKQRARQTLEFKLPDQYKN